MRSQCGSPVPDDRSGRGRGSVQRRQVMTCPVAGTALLVGTRDRRGDRRGRDLRRGRRVASGAQSVLGGDHPGRRLDGRQVRACVAADTGVGTSRSQNVVNRCVIQVPVVATACPTERGRRLATAMARETARSANHTVDLGDVVVARVTTSSGASREACRPCGDEVGSVDLAMLRARRRMAPGSRARPVPSTGDGVPRPRVARGAGRVPDDRPQVHGRVA